MSVQEQIQFDNTSVPVVDIQGDESWFSFDLLRDLWEYRELLFFLAWRDVMVRYKQSILGIGWAILQPLLTMVVFTLVFGNFAKIPSDGLPYPVFSYTALLPWGLFSQAISRSGTSLVGNAGLISKVYFPRLIIPLSAVIAPIVDFGFAFIILLGMMVWFGLVPTWGVIALPIFLLLTLATALAVSLWLAALNVQYRDVGYLIPFMMQLWMYASPVVYPVSMVPDQWRLLFSLNPMSGVIEGFRWALLGKANPDFGMMAISSLIVFVLLIGGLIYFHRTESTFADVV
jgi:lipopolysaccharide transport system permease protein